MRIGVATAGATESLEGFQNRRRSVLEPGTAPAFLSFRRIRLMSSEIAKQFVELLETYGAVTSDPRDGSPIDGCAGAEVVICSECANVWVRAFGVSRSWWCPRCSAHQNRDSLCQCGHSFATHSTARPRRADSDGDLGECAGCECWWYRPSRTSIQAASGAAP